MNTEEITGKKIQSLADMIDLEESLRYQSSNGHYNQWAFRGQPQEFGNLVPSFERQFSRKSHGAAELIEKKLLEAFRKHYAQLEELTSDMPQPNSIGIGHDLVCLSVMQHYEIPTRLLDWTSDFWTAVYFACAGDPGSKGELWQYDRRMFVVQREKEPTFNALVGGDPFGAPEPIILGTRGSAKIYELDPQLSPRMKRQFAHHTVCTSVFSDHVHLLFGLQKTAFPEVASPKWFMKHTIDAPCKPKALQYLAEHLGINASSVFPDVVGLGRFLRWQFESLRTMFQ